MVVLEALQLLLSVLSLPQLTLQLPQGQRIPVGGSQALSWLRSKRQPPSYPSDILPTVFAQMDSDDTSSAAVTG